MENDFFGMDETFSSEQGMAVAFQLTGSGVIDPSYGSLRIARYEYGYDPEDS